jgi:ABC-type uncharacterized transport system fused permease/ATPase subunit|uniref:Uncharacterized protein n=1 Tax=Sipha flava TaxID=143950 RepID=A0A2S2QI65_9HEMI
MNKNIIILHTMTTTYDVDGIPEFLNLFSLAYASTNLTVFFILFVIIITFITDSCKLRALESGNHRCFSFSLHKENQNIFYIALGRFPSRLLNCHLIKFISTVKGRLCLIFFIVVRGQVG